MKAQYALTRIEVKLIITPGFWIGTGGMLGWVCHILSAMQAYRQAERYEYRYR